MGVAFYVMAAWCGACETGALRSGTAANPADLLDLVALGTVADVVPLDFNNRILVSQGLRRIVRRCAAGLRALLESAGRTLATVIGQDLAFQAGPRPMPPDAGGHGPRHPLPADRRSRRGPQALAACRSLRRRQLETKMQLDALTQLDAKTSAFDGDLPAGICVYDDSWHQGVIGLVASRVKERLHRPVVAFAPAEQPGWVKGSARSVPGVHVRDVLDAVATRHPGLLDKFGGHAMAAGMTLRADDLPAFERAFVEEVARWIDDDTLAGHLLSDGELRSGEFTLETAAALSAGVIREPSFPEPCSPVDSA